MSEMSFSVAPEHSSVLEKLLEHLFVGDLLRCLWQSGVRDMEVLRAEVDWGGYDLVLEANGVLRYLQLKASHATAKAREVKINTNLERKPGGCVIWMRYSPATLALGPFFWFGGKPRQAMPSLGEKIARHTKGNKEGVKAQRPNIRLLTTTRFDKLESMRAVADALFGVSLPGGASREPR